VIAGAIVAGAVLIAATAAGVAWRRHEGRLSGARGRHLGAAQLGHRLGERATLLQFSSSFCAPCRATRHLLAGVAARQPGVAHIELDVADRLDLVRLLDIRRTPTVVVLDAHGRLTQRASGLPSADDIAAAVAAAAGPPAGSVTAPAAPPAGSEQPKPAHPHGSDSGHGRA
jgi:thiol-disulfide isomerase/thioredoxin